jgi:hypothetical protein
MAMLKTRFHFWGRLLDRLVRTAPDKPKTSQALDSQDYAWTACPSATRLMFDNCGTGGGAPALEAPLGRIRHALNAIRFLKDLRQASWIRWDSKADWLGIFLESSRIWPVFLFNDYTRER